MDGGIESKGSVAVAVALCRCLPLACLIVAAYLAYLIFESKGEGFVAVA